MTTMALARLLTKQPVSYISPFVIDR